MKPKWTPIKLRLGQIQAWDKNPRMSNKSQAQRIIASEKKFGQPVPFLVAPEQDGRFLLYDGHQRLAAWFTVYGADYEMEAMVSDRPLTEAEHKELVITLHTGATGSWNWDALASWSAGDLQEWGMNTDALKTWNTDANNLKELLNAETAEPVDAEPQIDRAAELAEKWQTASGQLWKLGDHRLLIGDCTVRENVERLMGGERADMVNIDPPYGVEYSGQSSSMFYGKDKKGKEREQIEGDKNIYDAIELIRNSIPLFNAKIYFIWHAPQYHSETKRVIEELGKTVFSVIVWNKNHANFGAMGATYKPKYEMALACKLDKIPFYGADNETTVWDFDRLSANKNHPTEKPTLLFERAIKNHTQINEIVSDFFAGSGTTIIAAHNLNRRCYAMEISEKYGAVILERFYTATGITPELVE